MADGARPVRRWGHCSCALPDGRVLVVGGWGSAADADAPERETRSCAVACFDPQRRVWQLPAVAGDVPPARERHCALLMEDLPWPDSSARECGVLLCGGRQGPDAPLSDVHALRLRDWRWVRVECVGAAPPARFRHAAVALGGGRVFVSGGCAGGGALVEEGLFALDCQRLPFRWSAVPCVGPQPAPRHSHSATALSPHTFALVGGLATCSAYEWPVDEGVLEFDARTLTWRALSSLPAGLYSHTATLVGGRHLLLLGGAGPRRRETASAAATTATTHVAAFDVARARWYVPECDEAAARALERVLLFKHAAVAVASGAADGATRVVLTGGGALCFSFGTFFNEAALVLRCDNAHGDELRLVLDSPPGVCDGAGEKAAAAAEPATAAPAAPAAAAAAAAHRCDACAATFASRSQLFKHLRALKHTVVK